MKILIILILITNLYSNTKDKMFTLYKNKNYEKACNIGFNNFKKNMNDEVFLSLYGFSCLKADNIDRIATPTAMLKFSEESRANSAYFSTILMQKKLLFHSLLDGYNISSLNLPTTEYILSKVFDLYSKIDKTYKNKSYFFIDSKNNKISYKLYLYKGRKIDKMVIEEFYNNISVKKHIYW